MSAKQVTNLRKVGKLREAYTLANELLIQDPDNIYNKGAMSWVYYNYLDKNCSVETLDNFIKILNKLKDLDLPENHHMVFDASAWKIGKMIFALHNLESIPYKRVDEIFEIIKYFHFTKPSEAYTFIYTSFYKGYKNWSKFLEFAEWWGYDNFLPENYQKEEINGRKIMSIVERAHIAYCKVLLQGELIDYLGIERAINKNKIRDYIPMLEKLTLQNPQYNYPPYYLSKLYLALGENEKALIALLPFAKLKKEEFWVWDLMAEIHEEHEDIQFSCYCKALTLKASIKFLINLKRKLINLLIKRGLFSEAKTEILEVKKVYDSNGWNKPNDLTLLTGTDWFKNYDQTNSNKELYKNNLNKAEKILFRDTPEDIIVVEFINKNKSILNFVKNKNKYGFFNYAGHIESPKIGDILKVRFKKGDPIGYHQVLTVAYTDQQPTDEILKTFKGNLRLINNNFGFIDDIFIEPMIIKESHLEDNQFVTGKAVLSYNKKKNEWGWKAISINS